jgi:CBS domain-containing protein
MSIESTPVSSLMTRNVITQTEDQNVHAVSKTMHENNIGSVVIVRNKDRDNDIISSNKPIGIITERDIVRILGSLDPSLLKVPIRELMSKPLITVAPNGSIKDVIQTMQLKNIRRLVVVAVEKEGKENNQNDNKMIGIITDKDIFRAIMKNQDLIPSFLSEQLPVERKTLYEQFSEYWFDDILHKR